MARPPKSNAAKRAAGKRPHHSRDKNKDSGFAVAKTPAQGALPREWIQKDRLAATAVIDFLKQNQQWHEHFRPSLIIIFEQIRQHRAVGENIKRLEVIITDLQVRRVAKRLTIDQALDLDKQIAITLGEQRKQRELIVSITQGFLSQGARHFGLTPYASAILFSALPAATRNPHNLLESILKETRVVLSA